MIVGGSSSSNEVHVSEASELQKPAVLAVIPCLNEAAYIEEVALKLLDDAGSLALTVVIADGGSTDGTREIAQRLAATHPEIVLLDNGKKIQSAALNCAVEQFAAGKEYLVRVDAHCAYPDNYCRRLVEIQKETGAASVAVRMTAKGNTCFQRAAAAAQNSRLGNGGSPHRGTGAGRFVDHGHHALMLVSAFRGVGGYDESFSHNEDAELDMRLRAANFRIWLAGDFSVTYFPRASARALFRQYFSYGRGRCRTLAKHRKWPKLRQSLPMATAPATALALLSPLEPALAVPAIVWALLCVGYGSFLGIRAQQPCAASAGFAAMIAHLAWSAGFLTTAAKPLAGYVFGGRQGSSKLSMQPLRKNIGI